MTKFIEILLIILSILSLTWYAAVFLTTTSFSLILMSTIGFIISFLLFSKVVWELVK